MIRLATLSDAAQIQAIYAPIVVETAISFELEPPSSGVMQTRISKILEAGFPWLVHAENGRILGYVYAGPHRGDRPAYRWSVEVSVYIASEAQGRGIGRGLYTSLFEVLALQNFQNAFAGATLPNEASVALHELMGFKTAGIFEAIGFKFDAWHDVIWWRRSLGAHEVPPVEIVPLPQALKLPGWAAALTAGERLPRSQDG